MRAGYSPARITTYAQLLRALEDVTVELRRIALHGEDLLTPFERRYVGRALNAVTIALHPGYYAGSDPNMMCAQEDGHDE
jgi:hypothetical protein